MEQSVKQRFEYEQNHMDTRVSIVVDSVASAKTVAANAQQAFEVFEKLEQIFSVFRQDSEISQFNMLAGQPQKVSTLLFELCGYAVALARESAGVFNPLVGLYTAPNWNSSDAADDVDLCDYSKIEMLESDQTIKIPQGATLDLNALVKGTALDMAMSCFGPGDRVIIEAGGDVKLSELDQADEPWKLGVRDPLNPQSLLTVLTLRGGSVCTSGVYFRNRKNLNNKRFHLIDLHTRREQQEVLSATVVSASAARADALSTLLFLLPIKDGIEFIQSQQDAECLLVDQSRESYVSPNFKQYLITSHANS